MSRKVIFSYLFFIIYGLLGYWFYFIKGRESGVLLTKIIGIVLMIFSLSFTLISLLMLMKKKLNKKKS